MRTVYQAVTDDELELPVLQCDNEFEMLYKLDRIGLLDSLRRCIKLGGKTWFGGQRIRILVLQI